MELLTGHSPKAVWLDELLALGKGWVQGGGVVGVGGVEESRMPENQLQGSAEPLFLPLGFSCLRDTSFALQEKVGCGYIGKEWVPITQCLSV